MPRSGRLIPPGWWSDDCRGRHRWERARAGDRLIVPDRGAGGEIASGAAPEATRPAGPTGVALRTRLCGAFPSPIPFINNRPPSRGEAMRRRRAPMFLTGVIATVVGSAGRSVVGATQRRPGGPPQRTVTLLSSGPATAPQAPPAPAPREPVNLDVLAQQGDGQGPAQRRRYQHRRPRPPERSAGDQGRRLGVPDRLGGQAVHRRRPPPAGGRGQSDAQRTGPPIAGHHAACLRRLRRQRVLGAWRAQCRHRPDRRPATDCATPAHPGTAIGGPP